MNGKTWLAILALALPAGLGASQSVLDGAGLAYPMLTADGSPRAAALGGAFAGLADDASAILVNPAGLGQLELPELGFSHNAWLVDSSQELALGALPLGPGVAGLSLGFFNFGSFEGRDALGNRGANFGASRFDLGLGWGQALGPHLLWGATGRLSVESLADQGYVSGALDLGLLAELIPRLCLGLAAQNLGTAVADGAQAFDLQLGLSYGGPIGGDQSFLFTLGSSLEPAGLNRLMAGVEYGLNPMLALRGGYQTVLNHSGPDGVATPSAGFGVKLYGLQFDYAFVPYGELGNSHRLGLSAHFPAAAPAEAEAPAGAAKPAVPEP